MEIRKRKVSNIVLIPEVDALMREGHTVTIPLKGNSMRPYLVHNRDKALLAKPGRMLSVGDVVLAAVSTDRYVLHRLVGVGDECDNKTCCPSDSDIRIILRGDGNFVSESCLASDVIAVAIAFYRNGSETADYVTSLSYRMYSWIWMHTLSVRRYLLKLDDIIFHSLKDLNQ